ALKGKLIMKTPEELNTLKEEVADMKKKLSELTDDELTLVTGGGVPTELMLESSDGSGPAIDNKEKWYFG
ncbi:MAG: hypothetical protein Q4F31_10730, partial [Eubacteriales bacterium]|nr:hypothetical protein [Eubacteriales bacterium]